MNLEQLKLLKYSTNIMLFTVLILFVAICNARQEILMESETLVCDNTLLITYTDISDFGNTVFNGGITCINDFIKDIDYSCSDNENYVDEYNFNYRIRKIGTKKVATVNILITGVVPLVYAELVERHVNSLTTCPLASRNLLSIFLIIVMSLLSIALVVIIHNCVTLNLDIMRRRKLEKEMEDKYKRTTTAPLNNPFIVPKTGQK